MSAGRSSVSEVRFLPRAAHPNCVANDASFSEPRCCDAAGRRRLSECSADGRRIHSRPDRDPAGRRRLPTPKYRRVVAARFLTSAPAHSPQLWLGGADACPSKRAVGWRRASLRLGTFGCSEARRPLYLVGLSNSLPSIAPAVGVRLIAETDHASGANAHASFGERYRVGG